MDDLQINTAKVLLGTAEKKPLGYRVAPWLILGFVCLYIYLINDNWRTAERNLEDAEAALEIKEIELIDAQQKITELEEENRVLKESSY